MKGGIESLRKIRKRIFAWLYYKLFSNGQAYKSWIHYDIANFLKRLAGWPY